MRRKWEGGIRIKAEVANNRGRRREGGKQGKEGRKEWI